MVGVGSDIVPSRHRHPLPPAAAGNGYLWHDPAVMTGVAMATSPL